ncbi:hypothetical protein [Halomonas smyrnensis]|uniref:hypothetical protein n=1 Tax=Halomonas smyrnensis TaxID=720605 RepID=UPI0003768CC4|nr:hypothetical protein [Halomonas smyrnensis]
MSLSAIIVMLASIAALWGVASLTLVHSMRQEERKLELIEAQGNFESFSPAAQRDLESWIERHPKGEPAQEVRELLDLQHKTLRDNPRHFYAWPGQNSAPEH